MKAFAALYAALDASTSSLAKRAAVVAYLGVAPAADAAWALYLLAGGKPRQAVPSRVMREAAQAASGLPAWLFDECYEAVGDLAETIALLLPASLPAPAAPAMGPAWPDALAGLGAWLRDGLLPLRGQPHEAQQAGLLALWAGLPPETRLVANKLVTGALRVGVSRLLVTRALADFSGLDAALLAQRLMRFTSSRHAPTAADHAALLAPVDEAAQGTAPWPFFLAHALPPGPDGADADVQALGPPQHWLAEWKWDGIRAQVVRRGGQVALWSRGEELLDDALPELAAAALAHLPDGCVLDGEVLAWQGERPLPFQQLQQRLNRQRVTPALQRACPVLFMAFDLLEQDGQDLRGLPLAKRRARLEALLPAATGPLRCSPRLQATDWASLAALRATARAQGVEGLMLKALDSRYGIGRTREAGLWWKWKLAPYSIDAVLLYAQAGHGRRANLYTDYTFAVWNAPPGTPERALVPVAKAYSGLSDTEITEVDRFVRRHTLEKFGPVRSVLPQLVFELGFEGIARSPRHKSGVALRFPRMLRWRQDKPAEAADSLADLQNLLPPTKHGGATGGL
jgi:DNA ligase-1